MTQAPLTPWSMVDDESESPAETGGATFATAAESHASDFADGAARPARAPVAHWALAPLTLAVLWVVGLMAAEDSALSAFSGFVLLLLIGGAWAIVVLSRIYRRRRLRAAHRVLCAGATDPRQALAGVPLADELLPLLEAVEQHATGLQRQSTNLVEEQKRLALELSLAESRRRQTEAVFTAIGDPLVVTDAFDQIIFTNAAAAAVFGFNRSEAARKPVAELIGDERLMHLIRQARDADLRAANRRAEFEVGQRVYVAATSALPAGGESADDPRRQPHGVVLLLRDITKEREATRHKSEFVARAAHELRTPLSAIRAYVEMLVDGEADDEKTRREYYDIIHSSADRLARMIDNILNISRIEAGTVRINKEPVAVAMIVKESVDVLRPQAEEKKLTLEEELTPVVYRVNADRDLIAQAVLNLLSNAIKYTPEGGRVQVRIVPQEVEQTIRIEIADTGAGIPREDLPRMFEKFFRVEANKKMAGGTGLGLNLVKHIVETIHEGKITLASEVGKGSTFGIVLPLLP